MVYGYTRSDKFGFISVLINNDTISHKIEVPINNSLVVDLLTGRQYSVNNGLLDISLEPMSGVVLK